MSLVHYVVFGPTYKQNTRREKTSSKRGKIGNTHRALRDNIMEAKSNQAKPRKHVMQVWKKNVKKKEQIEQCG